MSAFDVVGLVVGAALPEVWRMSERQSDVVVATEHAPRCEQASGLLQVLGEDNDPDETERALEERWYGGHFICESVVHEARHLVLAAPMMRGVIDRIAALDIGTMSPAGKGLVLDTVIALARAAQLLAENGRAQRLLPAAGGGR